MNQNTCNAFKDPAFDPRAQRTSQETAPQEAVAVRQAPRRTRNACQASRLNPANDCDIRTPANPADITAKRPTSLQSFSNRNYETMIELGLIAICCVSTLYSLARLL